MSGLPNKNAQFNAQNASQPYGTNHAPTLANELDEATDAEEKLLASVLLDPVLIHETKKKTPLQAFSDYKYNARNGNEYGNRARVYSAMLECEHPDMITLAKQMVNMGIRHNGDIAYINSLIGNCATHLDWAFYCQAVNTYYARRMVVYYTNKGQLDKAQAILQRVNNPVNSKYRGCD